VTDRHWFIEAVEEIATALGTEGIDIAETILVAHGIPAESLLFLSLGNRKGLSRAEEELQYRRCLQEQPDGIVAALVEHFGLKLENPVPVLATSPVESALRPDAVHGTSAAQNVNLSGSIIGNIAMTGAGDVVQETISQTSITTDLDQIGEFVALLRAALEEHGDNLTPEHAELLREQANTLGAEIERGPTADLSVISRAVRVVRDIGVNIAGSALWAQISPLLAAIVNTAP